MPLTGTLINTALIALGTAVGLLVKKILPERLKETLMQAISLVVMFIGICGAVAAALRAGEDGVLDTNYTLIMILAMVIGTVIGELLNIEGHLDSLGKRAQKRFAAGGKSTFAEGMVTATLLFCIGAMAVVGALDNGIRGSYDVLLAKSIIDGVTSAVLASTLGVGVLFSAFFVFLYQGAISLLGVSIEPLLSDAVVSQMSLVGSILIFAVGLKMMGNTKLKIGNFLPAVFMPMLFDLILRLVH